MKEGFTTGSAAAAAAAAAVGLLCGRTCPQRIAIPLPPFDPALPKRLEIPVHEARLLADGAMAAVIKDGGDDPDATHRARIEAIVHIDASLPALEAHIDGGAGVGRVTLPGLPVPVGEAAINPVPRRQIRYAVREILADSDAAPRHGVRVIISVPDGERIARHTLNARLGILGGISILGTHGTVRAFSHEAWQSVILQSMDMALANRPPGRREALPALCLSTGRSSERLLMARYPALPPLYFIQAGDYVEFSLNAAAQRACTPLAWGCFFGKLLKLAQGMPNTHARNAPPDMSLVVRCMAADAAPGMRARLAACNTAHQALDLLLAAPGGYGAIARLVRLAKDRAQSFAGGPVIVHLFHSDGRELATV